MHKLVKLILKFQYAFYSFLTQSSFGAIVANLCELDAHLRAAYPSLGLSLNSLQRVQHFDPE